jgi:hypothetical protein
MKRCFVRYFLIEITLATFAAAVALLAPAPAQATSTAWVHGGNWASADGILTDIQYPDGISSSTTTTQAAAEADTVASDLEGIGVNFVRIPVNPATISRPGNNWTVEQALINELVHDGISVDICCFYTDWQNSGTITNMSWWETMWTTVDGVYKNNNSVYYEPINEPFGYTASGLESVYTTFLGLVSKSQSHIILGGTGYEDHVAAIGAYFPNTLLAVHDYPFWLTSNNHTVAAWESQLSGEVSTYSSRTIMTEMGADTVGGLNYAVSSTDSNVCFIQGVSAQCNSYSPPMGFVYFPTHQASGNTKRLFVGPGAGIFNQSMVNALQGGWNIDFEGVEDGAAVINSLPTPEIAGVDESGNIYHKWIQTDGDWSSWTLLGAPPGGAKQWGAVIAINASGYLEIFVTGTNGAVYHAVESASGWSTFSTLGGGGGNLSSPAVIPDNDGRLNLFVVGGDNGIWWDKQTVPGGSWSGWSEISGTTAASGQAPTAILNAGGDLEVFYNNTANTGVCHFWQKTSGGSDWTWTGQNTLPGGGNNLSGLTATRNVDGRVDVEVVGSDTNVWHDYQTTPGGNWNGWSTIDTSEKSVSGQAPCVGVDQSGALEIFMNSLNGHVYRNWQTTPGGGWNSWTDMGGGGGNLTRFWAVTQANGDLEVFVVGGGNAVWTDSQNSPGGSWTGWSSLFGVYDCW